MCRKRKPRAPGTNMPQLPMVDPKPDDLFLSRMKCPERGMEVRTYDDVQISIMTWEKVKNSNLVRELLVPSEDARRRALDENTYAVEHYILKVDARALLQLINSERVRFVDSDRRDGRDKRGLRERNNSDDG